jgi:hypothetical protein
MARCEVPDRSPGRTAEGPKPLLFSYIVARDFGFAPNPFYGVCTLATCKPQIRRSAQPGDWVIGTGSRAKGLDGRLVFAMEVEETLSFEEYWSDPRFLLKRPRLTGSVKQAFGDNIYHKDPVTGDWLQENSHHTFPNGSPNPRNIDADTKAPRVLVGRNFMYLGGQGPEIPKRFRDRHGYDIVCKTQGHKCRFPRSLVAEFISWVNALSDRGYVWPPADW